MTDASGFSGEHCLPRNYAEELLIIDRGSGVWLYDRDGTRYLDMGSGIAVNALGYGREDLAEIASAQMRKVIHVSNLYTTEPTLLLARQLVDARIGAWNPDFGAVHFGNSGTEANEAAIKYARVYAQRTHGPQKHKLLGFHNGFHGRTLGALSLTYTPKYRKPFEPLVPGCVFAPFNDDDALKATLDDSFAGVIVEVVQGEGGLACMTPQFAESLNRLCRKHKALLIADEVQTGLGRTGNLFASEAVGLHPEIVSLSKPLGGGLPLSATLINRRINDVLEIGDHGTTFGGGPVTAAVALRVWQIIADPAFLADVRRRASHLEHCLHKLTRRFDFTGHLCGTGLLRGLPVQAAERRLPDIMTAILTAARERGLLLLRSGSNVIRIAPPLVISEHEIDEGCAILKSSLQAVATQFKGELHE